MESPDQSSDIAYIQSQVNSLTQSFDQAVARDAELAELKKIFHEIRIWRDKLEQLNSSMEKNSE